MQPLNIPDRRPGVFQKRRMASALRQRSFHRPARLVKPHAAQRLLRALCAVQQRAPGGSPERCADGFRQFRRGGTGSSGGVAVDLAGTLLVADDVGNTVGRVTPSPGKIAKVQHQRFIEPADLHDTMPFVGR
jgi:hypothetical protein